MIPGPTRDTGSALEGSFSVEPLDWWRARQRGERLSQHALRCEFCGAPVPEPIVSATPQGELLACQTCVEEALS